jgi:hypothetical protein
MPGRARRSAQPKVRCSRGTTRAGSWCGPSPARTPDKTAGVIGLNTPDLPRLPVPTTQFLQESAPSGTSTSFNFKSAAEVAIEPDIDAFVRSVFLGPATVRKDTFTEEDLSIYADAFRPRGAITPPLEYYRNMDRKLGAAGEVRAPKDRGPLPHDHGRWDPFLPAPSPRAWKSACRLPEF